MVVVTAGPPVVVVAEVDELTLASSPLQQAASIPITVTTTSRAIGRKVALSCSDVVQDTVALWNSRSLRDRSAPHHAPPPLDGLGGEPGPVAETRKVMLFVLHRYLSNRLFRRA